MTSQIFMSPLQDPSLQSEMAGATSPQPPTEPVLFCCSPVPFCCGCSATRKRREGRFSSSVLAWGAQKSAPRSTAKQEKKEAKVCSATEMALSVPSLPTSSLGAMGNREGTFQRLLAAGQVSYLLVLLVFSLISSFYCYCA